VFIRGEEEMISAYLRKSAANNVRLSAKG